MIFMDCVYVSYERCLWGGRGGKAFGSNCIVYIHVFVCMCSVMTNSWAVTCQAPLPMGFSKQGYWSGLPFPAPGDLSDPGIKPASPALAGRFFTTMPPGKTRILSLPIHSKITVDCIIPLGFVTGTASSALPMAIKRIIPSQVSTSLGLVRQNVTLCVTLIELSCNKLSTISHGFLYISGIRKWSGHHIPRVTTLRGWGPGMVLFSLLHLSSVFFLAMKIYLKLGLSSVERPNFKYIFIAKK